MADLGPHLDAFRHYEYLFSGQRTATVTIPLHSTPWPCHLANPKAGARVGDAVDTATLTVDVQAVTTSKLAAPIAVTEADTEVAGTPAADPSIDAGVQLNCVLTIGGNTPTWDDVRVTFDLLRTA
jgi:hypothetical protein